MSARLEFIARGPSTIALRGAEQSLLLAEPVPLVVVLRLEVIPKGGCDTAAGVLPCLPCLSVHTVSSETLHQAMRRTVNKACMREQACGLS